MYIYIHIYLYYICFLKNTINEAISTKLHLIPGSLLHVTGLARDDPRIHFAQILGMMGMPSSWFFPESHA